ncbi:MAG: hypothetical protein JNK05_19470 [Myxococcales bacterium]|nr:hypothetical protein [Myxococcales bacterium]
MKRRFALTLVALGACAQHTQPLRCPPTTAARRSAPRVDRPSQTAEAPPAILAQRVEAIVRGAAPSGARFVRYVANGFLTERQSVTSGVDVPAGTCVSLVAFASPGVSDLDARVYDAEGELLVEDVEPDSHPTVQLCADEARRVFHVAQAFEGEGAYALALFTGDRRAMEAIARVVGGRPGTAVSTRNNASDSERRMSELRASLARRGFAPLNDATRLSFAAGGAVSVPVSVTPDRCYTFAAIADNEGASVDLRVLDGDNELQAFDARPDRDAAAQLCPSAQGPMRVEVRGQSAGSAVVLAFAADAASFGGSNTLWLGERTSIALSPTPIEQRIASIRARFSALGFAPVNALAPVAFAMSESRESAMQLEPARCTLVSSVAGRGVGRNALAVFDDSGELLARGAYADSATSTVLCATSRERVLARQRVEVGGGELALVTGTIAAPPWTQGVERLLVAEAFSQQLAHAAPWRSIAPPERLRVGASAARAREFDLSAGTCTRAIVSVGRPLSPLSLTLRGPSGAELARGSGFGSARLTHCVVLPTRVRLEVELEPREPERDALWQRFERPDNERFAETGATPP